jgi:hypothetical protein
VLCGEAGFYVTYESDEHGFNNPAGIISNSEIDIALTGDSYTLGNCVKPGQDISAQIRRKTEKNVLNLGYAGNGPLIELAALVEYAEPLKPKIVLWMYFEGNDFVDLTFERSSPILMEYLREGFSQELINKRAAIDDALEIHVNKSMAALGDGTWATQVERVVRLTRWRNVLGLTAKEVRFPDEPSVHELFKGTLTRARNEVSAWGGRLHFVYLPFYGRYTSQRGDDYLGRAKVLKAVRDLNIPIIDFHETLGKHPDPLSLFPFRICGHYNAEGYRLLAEQIADSLETD